MSVADTRSWIHITFVVSALVYFAGAWSCVRAQQAQIDRFAIYYSDQSSLATLAPFDLLVFDSSTHPELQTLSDRKKVLLGYVSLGEVEKHRPWFHAVRNEGLLLQENNYWPGSWYVDVRDPRWVKRVIEDLLPDILRRGFDGIFIDTLDNPSHLERVDPEANRGMREAAVRLVQTVRRHYPGITIMLNRAYEILPDVVEHIDMLLGESVFADYDFETQTYRRVQEPLYKKQVEILQAAREKNPGLQVMTLDYWDPEDELGIAQIYDEQRKNGFVPYVATIALDRIIVEPKP